MGFESEILFELSAKTASKRASKKMYSVDALNYVLLDLFGGVAGSRQGI